MYNYANEKYTHRHIYIYRYIYILYIYIYIYQLLNVRGSPGVSSIPVPSPICQGSSQPPATHGEASRNQHAAISVATTCR